MKVKKAMHSGLLVLGSLALAMLVGCATKPLTPEQQIFREAENACRADSNVMIDNESYGFYSLAWSSYFEWCMQQKGYSKEDLKNIWY